MNRSNLANDPDMYTASFVRETAGVLVKAYELHLHGDWLVSMAQGWECTAQEIVESWIWRYVRQVSPAMADTMFQMLLLEFEVLYFEKEVR